MGNTLRASLPACFIAIGLLGGGWAQANDTEAGLRASWREGLRFETADKRFQARLSGRLFNDFAVHSLDDKLKPWVAFVNGRNADFEDNAEFRLARLVLTATLYERVDFKAEYDVAQGDGRLIEAYLGVKDLPWLGEVRAGHFKEPFSLEELTSIRYVTFMERGLPNVFTPARNTGVAFRANAVRRRVSYMAGVFRETDKVTDPSDGWGASARVTGIPWDDNEHLVHLGLGVTHRLRDDDADVRFAQGPESHSQLDFVGTLPVDADAYSVIGAEAALVHGPWSLQGEYMYTVVDGLRDPELDGFYVFASWFPTGEYRPYDRSAAVFDRIHPKRAFLGGGGPGALEFAARFSRLDLKDAGSLSGNLQDVTLGLNWYLDPNVRLMLNYIHSWVNGYLIALANDDSVLTHGDADVWQARLQFEF